MLEQNVRFINCSICSWLEFSEVIDMTFRRIRDLREDSDWAQAFVGAAIGLPQRTYAYYESEGRSIPPEIRGRLADLYGTSVDYLMGRTDVRAPYPPAKRRRD